MSKAECVVVSLLLAVAAPLCAQQPNIDLVVLATYDHKPLNTIAPEAQVTVFGKNLGGAKFYVCGLGPARVLEQSGEQATILVPDLVTGPMSCDLWAISNTAIVSNKKKVEIVKSLVGLSRYSGRLAVATHADYSYVTQAAPARSGEVLIFWGTGGGRTQLGEMSGVRGSILVESTTAELIGVGPIEVLWAGELQGEPGRMQLVLRMPNFSLPAPSQRAILIKIAGDEAAASLWFK